MAKTKTKTVSFRTSPETRGLLTLAAEAERRTLSNVFEIMVHEYCDRRGISVTAPTAPAKGGKGGGK
jgi:hypothetical protein